MAEEPGPHGRTRERPDGPVQRELKAARRRRARGQERRISASLTGAGLVTREARIDAAEAVDVSYPGFFQQMAGGVGECGVKAAR